MFVTIRLIYNIYTCSFFNVVSISHACIVILYVQAKYKKAIHIRCHLAVYYMKAMRNVYTNMSIVSMLVVKQHYSGPNDS